LIVIEKCKNKIIKNVKSDQHYSVLSLSLTNKLVPTLNCLILCP
jgi:hypothetical protein